MIPRLSHPSQALRMTCGCGNVYWSFDDDHLVECQECLWNEREADVVYLYRVQPANGSTSYSYIGANNALQAVAHLEQTFPGIPVIIWRLVDTDSDECDVQVKNGLYTHREITKEELRQVVSNKAKLAHG